MNDRSQRPTLVPLVLGLALTLFLFGCGSDDDGDDEAPTTTASTTTEVDPTTSSSDPTSSVPTDDTGDDDGEGSGQDGDDGTGDGGTGDGGGDPQALSPGDECDLGAGIPDCIDPDGDGVGVYLIDGDLCASTAPDVSACEDADGDGVAGGEDEYSDLPTCGPDVAPPCNNPPGAHED